MADKVAAFWKGIENGASKHGQVSKEGSVAGGAHTTCKISVTFSHKQPRKSWFQVYMGDEEVPWEQWYIRFVHIKFLLSAP